VYCANCGNAIQRGDQFCNRCGAPTHEAGRHSISMVTIIAIILVIIVVIPVVMSGLLYLMVMGFGNGTPMQTPVAAASLIKQDSNEFKLTIMSVDRTDVAWSDCVFFMSVDGIGQTAIIPGTGSDQEIHVTIGAVSYLGVINDVSDPTHLGAGDYILISDDSGFTFQTYSFGLIYHPTGGMMTMVTYG
jgi:predicted nucleic acid-binding Zn ribbon protein